jgi:hypothetical protein
MAAKGGKWGFSYFVEYQIMQQNCFNNYSKKGWGARRASFFPIFIASISLSLHINIYNKVKGSIKLY